MNKQILLIIILIIINFHFVNLQNCGRQRCCNINPCISDYCQQKNIETWVSNENFLNYGYTKLVYSNNSCLPCAYNCKACSSQTSCISCSDDFSTNSGTCKLCPDHCKTCTTVNSIARCTQCLSGAYLNALTSLCVSCPNGAQLCSSQTSIIQCLPGYIKSSNSLFCSPCPSNCISCPQSDIKCASCASGYYLNFTDFRCYQCKKSNCSACLLSGLIQICTTCQPGYMIIAGNCQACPSHCLSCSSPTLCIKCQAAYTLTGGGCIVVSAIIINCDTYSNSNTCSACISGFYLNNNICYPCSITCKQCFGRHFGSCTSCISSAKLFNTMCLANNFPSQQTYQQYYSIPHIVNYLQGGSLTCSNSLYAGNRISLQLNRLSAYQLDLRWKVYTINNPLNYQVILNNITGTFITSSNFYSYCSTNYYLGIDSYSFTEINLNNSLIFTAIGGIISIEEILIVSKRCSSLCIECSSVLCKTCLTSNLYKQDAYCVYICGSDYYIYESQKSCLKQCPLGNYPQSTDRTCQPCVSPCYSCLNERVCLSCIFGYYLTQIGTCLQTCPFRYYGRIETQTCQKCIGRCFQCISQLQCISCRVGFLNSLTKTCVDDCNIAGYYSDIPTLSCITCNIQCLTCSLAANRCTSCKNGTFFYNYQCINMCPNLYFSNNGNCQLCVYPCETCSSNLTCTSCVDRYLLNSICLSSCPQGYYQENVFLRCLSCDINCTKCLAKADYCLQCKNGSYYFNFKCLSLCPDGYYGSNNTCFICSNLCRTCSNSTYCLSCNINFLYNGKCVRASQCPTKFYAQINVLKCLSCQSPCVTCQYTATRCTSCLSNSSTPYLQNFQCVSNCSSNTIYPSLNGKCIPCQQPCLSCLNQTFCLSCIRGYKYSNNICSSTCSISTYFNLSISDCKSCSQNCLVCNSDSFCQICTNGFYIYSESMTQASCLSNCPSGFYSDSFSRSCQKCLYPCQNCSSSIDCLSCQTGVLYQSRCLFNCPDSTYVSGKICLNCSSNCLTCIQLPTKCNLCKINYFLLNNSCLLVCPKGYYGQTLTQRCQLCPNTCSACLNNTNCTSCIIGKTYLNTITKMCVSSCPSGTYGNLKSQTCQSCQSKCLTCLSSSSNCLTCNIGYLLVRINSITFDCMTTCPQYYYSESSICYPCVFPCLDCLNSITCKSCVQGMVYHQISNTCLNTCPLQTYLSNGICLSCQLPCVTCLNSTFCFSCNNNLIVYNGNCVQACPLMYYADDSGICNQCYGFCKTCKSKFSCLTCNAGYAYDGYCYSLCPAGTYADAGACLSCSAPCLQCSVSSTYCSRCMNNLYVYKGNCSSTCPASTYVDTHQCKSCPFPCLSCLNQYTCQSCVGGYLLYLNKTCIANIDKCPNDFYKKDSIECVPITWCPDNYFIDEVLRTCSKECLNTKYTDTISKKCVNSCPTGYYVGKNLVCKSFQKDPPNSLLGMKSISFIKSSRVHIVIIFNESIQWKQTSNNLFTINFAQSRLLQSKSLIAYQQLPNTDLLVNLTNLPYMVSVYLPAYYLSSATTGLPLQITTVQVKIPDFQVYSSSQIYSGSIMGQLSQGISWLILLLSFIFLFLNRLSDLYILWDTVQLLYVLIFLNIQYPPSLNQFFVGLASTHLYFLPSLLTVSNVRNISALPFYAYSYDNNFFRTAGQSILILLIFTIIFLLLKLFQLLLKKVPKIRQFFQQYPLIKSLIYRGLLRYRWHHTSDVFFITYLNVLLFAIAEIFYIKQNPNRIFSNIFSIVLSIIYICFPIFVGYKLYKHFDNISKGKLVNNLKCFYRGVQKDNKFGISIILLRYLRKLVYAIMIALFSMTPMYALPILMFTSIIFGIFIFHTKPFKKKLSNIITFITQATLVVVFAIIAIIQFLKDNLSINQKQILGWVCCLLLAFMLFALIYEIFCKTLFYLEPQYQKQKSIKSNKSIKYDPLKDPNYIRKKAQQFFNIMLPQLREHFNLDDSDQEIHNYEQGDSQNSQNNDIRQRSWDLNSQNQQNFNHYAEGSQSQKTQSKQKQDKKVPNYLIRCVKEIK